MKHLSWLWTLPLLTLLAASPAAAAPTAPAPEGEGSFLDVFGVTTTNGVTLSQWQLSIDPGGALGVGNPFVQFIQVGWMAWRVGCGAAIWLIDVAQNLLWLKLIREPLITVTDPLIALLHESELAWLLGVSGIALAFLAWRHGKTGAAMLETIGVIIMFSLATGVLASPITGLTDAGGVLEKVQGIGDEATATLGEGQGENGATRTSQRLADLAIAQPAQLFNFGRLVPANCQGPYTNALTKGPYEEDDSAIRDAVKNCDATISEQSVTMIFGTWVVLAPTLFTVMLFGGMTGLVIIGLGSWIVWLSIQLVWDAIKGIAPGSGRASLIITLTSLGIALVLFVLAMIFLAVSSQALLEFYDYATGPEFDLDPFTVYLITDAILLLLLVLFIVKIFGAVRKARRNGEKIAKALTPKPRPMPQPITHRILNSPIGELGRHAAGSAVGNRLGNGALHDHGGPQPKPNGQAGVTASSGVRGSTLKSAAGMAGKASALAFHSTLGMPVTAPKIAAAAKAAATARSEEMRTKLSDTKARAKDHTTALSDYGSEWTHNVGVAAKWTGRAVGATQAATLIAPQLAPAAAAASIALSARNERRRTTAQTPPPPSSGTRQHGPTAPGTEQHQSSPPPPRQTDPRPGNVTTATPHSIRIPTPQPQTPPDRPVPTNAEWLAAKLARAKKSTPSTPTQMPTRGGPYDT